MIDLIEKLTGALIADADKPSRVRGEASAEGYKNMKVFPISGSHGPPWEPIPWLPRQDRYTFPRWSGGSEECFRH